MTSMLGVVRIAFGTLFLVRTTLLARPLNLPGLSPGVPFFGWPPPGGRFPLATMLHLPDGLLEGACIARTIAALLFAVGLWARPAGLVAGALAYLVATQEPPTFTMTMHVLFLGVIVLACTDACRVLALRPRPPDSPRSSLGLIRIWTASIYIWAGIAKLNADWLSGRVLGVWIEDRLVRGRVAAVLVGTAAQRAAIAPAIAASEIGLGALLLWRPTRRPALVGAFALHAIFELTTAPDLFGWAMAILLLAFIGDIGAWRQVFAWRVRSVARTGSLAALAVAASVASGCQGPPAVNAFPDCADPLVLSFVPDTGGADEAYVCFGFDAGLLGPATIQGVDWRPPSGGAFILHHAKISAVPSAFPAGPVPCDGMQAGALGLHVWAPGGDNLMLPADVGLSLPAGTVSLVIEAHTLRVGSGPAQTAQVALCRGSAAPAHLAALFGLSATVPALRPHLMDSSEATCTLAGDVHLFSVWPHMHLLGTEIGVTLLGSADAAASVLVDVNPWNFHAQRTYPLDVDATGGSQIGLRCTWFNTTDNYVFAGLRTEDEMCQAAFIAWPAAAASCAWN